MKPINALILSLSAGAATFAAQNSLFPPELHAAPHVVPVGPDWRNQMLERDRGEAGVDRAVSHLVQRLDLTTQQASKFSPILHQEHDRILALLLTAPASLTRSQFILDQREIETSTHRQLDALLTPEQLELVKELHAHRST